VTLKQQRFWVEIDFQFTNLFQQRSSYPCIRLQTKLEFATLRLVKFTALLITPFAKAVQVRKMATH